MYRSVWVYNSKNIKENCKMWRVESEKGMDGGAVVATAAAAAANYPFLFHSESDRFRTPKC